MPSEHEQLFQQVRLPRPRRHEPRNPWAMHGMQWMKWIVFYEQDYINKVENCIFDNKQGFYLSIRHGSTTNAKTRAR
ncbi:hypothetical protein RN001_016198 [Aquatica leii]|uniref:Uncharacterized protein n=1 Tax=Aquatica leii TaxID=1421715 RepID=A0AAN7PMZ0_9COLE|nr:hypothetical protein RN001_016198 [Aquatica leii]